MTPTDPALTLRADGEYEFTTAYAPGTQVIFQVEGSFGSGNAQIGYRNQAGTFTAYGSADALTAPGGYRVDVPASGKLALKIASATAPAITIAISRTAK